jgi:hypothetical protein
VEAAPLARHAERREPERRRRTGEAGVAVLYVALTVANGGYSSELTGGATVGVWWAVAIALAVGEWPRARLLPAAALAKLPVGPKLPLDPPNLDLEFLAVLIPSLVDCPHQPTEPTIGQGKRLGEPRRVDVAWESVRLLLGRRAVRGHRLCLPNSEITAWFGPERQR